MNQIVQTRPKAQVELDQEWNQLAEERHRQIESGDDISFDRVVVPAAKSLLAGVDVSVVLDVGSGTGEFTRQLAQIAGRVLAIEPSQASMAIARKVCAGSPNVSYLDMALEDAVTHLREQGPSGAVAMMTLMTVPSLTRFVQALADVLPEGAHFIATLTHPCFWPRYWGYDREPWFSYERELFIEAPFKISRQRSSVRTTHIHRPVSYYLNTFAEFGFGLREIIEPVPSPEIQRLYGEAWDFPRFLALKWERALARRK